MNFKKIIGTVGLCMSLLSLSAAAVPMYVSNTQGVITGVTGLVVRTDIYDMTLHHSTFDQLFADVGARALYSQRFAHDASAALVAFTTFQPVAAHRFLGCERVIFDFCGLTTTYQILDASTARGYAAVVADDFWPYLWEGTDPTGINQVHDSFATWDRVASSIPEPPMVLLIASGLVVLAVARRKVRA